MKLYNLYCRAFQFALKYGMYALNWDDPLFLRGPGSVSELARLIKSRGLRRILVVTDPGVTRLALPESFLRNLEEIGIFAAVYDRTSANPTIECVEEALKLYHKSNCEAIVAFGGGSPMDCAKLVGARVARPSTPVGKMRGLLKVIKKLPPLFAVATTAGTGSEVTLAAVVLDQGSREKYAVNDPRLRPQVAVLDPALTVVLPPHITATTGMDALTHAVEAYIGRSNTKRTAAKALEATQLIFANLEIAYNDSVNMQARENMLAASMAAGIAFTRAYVGNVHAIAHALGALYNVPHGFANAVIMPYVLDFYGEAIHARLADMADAAEIPGATQAEKAKAFIAAIRGMNERMGIPAKFDCIIESDLPYIAKHALREANPLYPVPVIMTKDDVMKIVKGLMA